MRDTGRSTMIVSLGRSGADTAWSHGEASQSLPANRVVVIDIARTVALFGMVVFHFARDLEVFGFLPPATTLTGAWPLFARFIAGSFLFLAGVSLVLAHGDAIRSGRFLKRLGQIAASAAAVTLATWIAMPDAFVFFGILHSIAVASVIGLVFLRQPAALIVIVATIVFVFPMLFRSEIFEAPWLIWTGLAESTPRTLDFEPVFPWLAPFLIGMAVARHATVAGLWDRLRVTSPGRLARWASWPGRHSLSIYLLHQPLLLGMLWCVWKLAT